MALFIFARFHAKSACESALGRVVREVIAASRAEPGCEHIHAFCCTHDSRLFYIHSRWKDEAAFELHAELSHTLLFLREVELLIDHPPEVTRAVLVA